MGTGVSEHSTQNGKDKGKLGQIVPQLQLENPEVGEQDSVKQLKFPGIAGVGPGQGVKGFQNDGSSRRVCVGGSVEREGTGKRVKFCVGKDARKVTFDERGTASEHFSTFVDGNPRDFQMSETGPRKEDGGQEGVIEGDATEMRSMGKDVEDLLFSTVVIGAEPKVVNTRGGVSCLSEDRDPFRRETVDFERAPSCRVGEKDTQDVEGRGDVVSESVSCLVGGGKDEGKGQGTWCGTGGQGLQRASIGDVSRLVESEGSGGPELGSSEGNIAPLGRDGSECQGHGGVGEATMLGHTVSRSTGRKLCSGSDIEWRTDQLENMR